MRKIAIPITEDNKLAHHFGRSKFYEIYVFSNQNEVLDIQLLEANYKRACKSDIFNVLAKMGVRYLLSDRIGDQASKKCDEVGIKVVSGCSGNSSGVVLTFLEYKC
ncbi:hypothetical protein FNB79_14705 [Formosa sediminum]|uniref:Dinitrogenase iron-molybdenum cofactor biosynthesis domain-containing protein n=1 Tax=Formosa sediminum TaxID=2594004 RepID=A0A516GUH2_9FLAO|nr:NifB/NifX family molybdenum-iron cluster-binding protein [Formosa sediminum]QDO95169.1 hypothetical protein FNB79_14705 [Formosa sediminum]